jgi:hypothetical protein
MKMWNQLGRVVTIAMGSVILLGGCASHYEVTDPGSNKTYYTTSFNAGRYMGSGAATFIDHRTGKEVTLQNSEIRKLDKEEFDRVAGPRYAK